MKPRLLVPLFLTVLLIAIATIASACGGGSREGSVVSQFELQKGDCFNSDDSPPSGIPLVACSNADREVLAALTFERSDYQEGSIFPGQDALDDHGHRLCREATDDEHDTIYRPDKNTWALNDRVLICAKKLGGGTSSTSNQDDQSDGNGSSNQGDDTNPRIGTTQTAFTLETGDCYTQTGPDFYITDCDQAEKRVLKVVVLKDRSWPGKDAISRAGKDFCPSGTDSRLIPTEGTWADGDREIVCSEILNGTSSSSGSSVPLYSSNVLDFSKGLVRASAGQLEAANRELDRVIDSGQQVISCQYGPSNPEAQTGYQSYGFWYKDVPDNIDALLLLARDTGVPDPVFHLGTNAISSCPDTRDEGEAAWRAGRS